MCAWAPCVFQLFVSRTMDSHCRICALTVWKLPVCSSMLCCHSIRDAWYCTARPHECEFFILFGMAYYWTCCLISGLHHYVQCSCFRVSFCLSLRSFAILFSMRHLILTAPYCVYMSHAADSGTCTSFYLHDQYASILAVWTPAHSLSRAYDAP